MLAIPAPRGIRKPRRVVVDRRLVAPCHSASERITLKIDAARILVASDRERLDAALIFILKIANKKPAKTTPTKTNRRNSQEEDSISVTSVGGIKGKLAALFSKEQTISESTIANKFKQEREKEMEMLQNRFHYKPKTETKQPNDSDEEASEHDPSEAAPLMGSTASLAQTAKKPEIISNIPKVSFDEAKKQDDRREKVEERNVSCSQDSPVVLSVLEDVKRIKVNNNKKETQGNGAVTSQPTSLYPHLSDIETDASNTQEEYSDCGGSRCGHYTLECVFLFLCI
ncbi:hypothetical protein MSG28_013642 [Choristoneura fumiferana]|uniref:Uncharacterized protein n=1 Tax=Choristoneura fumiferana TaxID=7141 RepID=A0ACC0K8F1_CHOFU|nr:hypothetical protein MSG28_013642 [Choristoneura fumiferana]